MCCIPVNGYSGFRQSGKKVQENIFISGLVENHSSYICHDVWEPYILHVFISYDSCALRYKEHINFQSAYRSTNHPEGLPPQQHFTCMLYMRHVSRWLYIQFTVTCLSTIKINLWSKVQQTLLRESMVISTLRSDKILSFLSRLSVTYFM